MDVHCPRSDVFVHEIVNISVVFLQPPATRIRGICTSSVRRSSPGLSRVSCIGESVRHRHDCPARLASPYKSSAQLTLISKQPPTTRTASGVCFTQRADASCRPVGILGRAVQLQNDITLIKFSGPASKHELNTKSGQVIKTFLFSFFSERINYFFTCDSPS